MIEIEQYLAKPNLPTLVFLEGESEASYTLYMMISTPTSPAGTNSPTGR